MHSSLSFRLLAGVCVLVVCACSAATTPSSNPTVKPTSTPRASMTPVALASATPTKQPSQVPTVPPTASPTQTPTALPSPGRTPSPSAGTPPPSIPIGNVIFADDFAGVTKYLSSGTQLEFGGGQYTNGIFDLVAVPRSDFLNFRDGATLQGCAGDNCSFPDVIHDNLVTATVQVDATQVSGTTSGQFGIACRYTGTIVAAFYGLTISADGRGYAVSHYSTPGDFPVADVLGGSIRGDANAAIQAGLGQTNHLRADCGQQGMSLSVNGQIVATAALDQPTGSPTTGIALIAAPGPDGPIDVQFDNLDVSELAQEPAASANAGVLFDDVLTTNNGYWPTGSLDAGSAEFTNGTYQVTIPNPSQYQELFPTTMTPPSDTSTQVDATFVGGPDTSLIGVICRSGFDGYYVFQVSANGFYSLYRATASGAYLVDWTQGSAIKPGLGQTNTIRLDCVGDTLTGYVNGTQLAQGTDSTLAGGEVGFGAVSATGEGGTTYDLANFAIRYPAP